MKAPSDFSLIRNPKPTVAFINEIAEQFSLKKNVFIDMNLIESATPDAVLVLVSRIKDRRFTRGKLSSGSVPLNHEVQELLFELGFYKHVSSGYSVRQNSGGLMVKKRSRKVEPDAAKTLIGFASVAKYGALQKCRGVYRVLIESMANTRDHAAVRSKEVEAWWLAAYCPKGSTKVQFVFVDNGVGIFRSAKLTTFMQTWGQVLGTTSRGDLLRDMMNGTIGSRTQLSYRGKGLPGIKNVQRRSEIKNLVILTNNIIGYVDSDDYQTLPSNFAGTLLSWEI